MKDYLAGDADRRILFLMLHTPSIVDTKEQGIWIVIPSGRLDPVGGPELEKFCQKTPPHPLAGLILDLSNVFFLSSAGLRSILCLWKHWQAQGSDLALCNMQPMVERVFRLAGFDSFMSFTATREQALALFPKKA